MDSTAHGMHVNTVVAAVICGSLDALKNSLQPCCEMLRP